MKALSIKEPHASFIRNGYKTIETRTWKTNHRGKILLCASKTPKSKISGHAFATADIVDCRKMTTADEPMGLAHCEIYPNAYSWVLENITELMPFPIKGQLGLFEVDYK